jgi:transglutaminase-like putative cysteine protease
MSFRRYLLRSAIAAFGLIATVVVASASAEETRESWDAVYMKGERVGYFHTQVIPVKDRGRDLFRVQIDMSLSFARNGDPVTIETLYGTIETPDGTVLRLDSRTLASKQEMRIFGDVVNEKMTLTFEGSGQKQQTTIPWGPDVRGPYGAEMSLVRNPMKPGESREVKIFIPDHNRIGVAKLQAKQVEEVTLGGGVKRELLRVEQNNYMDNQPIPGHAQTFWVDPSGQILRNSNPTLGGMETYRTTREAALRGVSGPKFDLTAASLIRVSRPIPNPTMTREIVFDLTLKGDDPAKVFPSDRRQTLTPSTLPGAARLVVKTAGPEVGSPMPETIDPKYLRANTLITSEDKRVVALAQQATAGITDAWQKAAAIQHWVYSNVKNKNFETAFAAANEVARDLEGDCSEHSVLTAAMCRASGIPCRVVVGLLYGDSPRGFGYHMWNEVYVNDRWVAIDSAWDQSAVDAVHIKLSDSSLDGVSPYETFLAIVRVFDKLAIDPVEIR